MMGGPKRPPKVVWEYAFSADCTSPRRVVAAVTHALISGLQCGFLLLLLAWSVSGEDAISTAMQDGKIHNIYAQCLRLLSKIHVDKTGIDEALALYQKVLVSAPLDTTEDYPVTLGDQVLLSFITAIDTVSTMALVEVD